MILVSPNPPSAQTLTHEEVADVIFNRANQRIVEASYQQTSLFGDIAGFFQISCSPSSCGTSTIEILGGFFAKQAGYDLTQYRRIVYVVTGVDYTVGGVSSGATVYIYTLHHTLVAHELGHSFGLRHDGAVQCGAVPLTSVATECQWVEQGHGISFMGSGDGHPSSFGKHHIGWLGAGASPPVAIVKQPGTFTLSTFEDRSSGDKALRVIRTNRLGTSIPDAFYLENRASGPLLSVTTNGRSYLLNTAQAPGWYAGTPWVDPLSQVSVQLQSWGPTSATVTIAFPGTSLSCTPATQTVVGGAPAVVTATGGIGIYQWLVDATGDFVGGPTLSRILSPGAHTVTPYSGAWWIGDPCAVMVSTDSGIPAPSAQGIPVVH